jgi:hypothetical protein
VPVEPGAATENGLGILVSILAGRREQFGLRGRLRVLSELHRPRDRRSIGEEPSLDARMSDPDRRRILMQLEVRL